MKKILSCLLLVSCLLSLCACEFTVSDMFSPNKVVYGEKYIHEDYTSKPENEQIYYIFEKDYLIFHYYADGSDITHYTITYKYELIDEETIAYFFDSIEIHDDDTRTVKSYYPYSEGVLIISKNVVMTLNGKLYVRQSYLDEELENYV
nr:hypothetical protein [Oscillospiraceae bacterium]